MLTQDEFIDMKLEQDDAIDSLLWEALGPDAFTGLFYGASPSKQAELTADYVGQIRDAVVFRDAEKLGKLLLGMAVGYLDYITEDEYYDYKQEYERDRAEWLADSYT